MELTNKWRPQIKLPNVISYLDSVNKIMTKVDTINNLSLFSTIVDSFPLETPGIEEAAQNITDIFFPQPQDQEDGLAYIFSHKNFVSLKQDIENLSQIFKDSDSTYHEGQLCSEGDETAFYELASSENGDEDNQMFEIASSVSSEKENKDIFNNFKSEGQETDLTTSNTDQHLSGQILEDKETNVKYEHLNQPCAFSLGKPSSNEEPGEALYNNPRQCLKELIVWIFEQLSEENVTLTDFDPLRGNCPSYYGLSSCPGKSNILTLHCPIHHSHIP